MIRTRAGLPFDHRFSVALLLSLLIAGALDVPALGQALPSVPDQVKTANDVTAHRAAIEAFVTQAVAQLANESPDLQTKAREALQKDALVKGQPTATPAYLNLYSQLL